MMRLGSELIYYSVTARSNMQSELQIQHSEVGFVSKYHAMEELAYTGHGNILRFLT
jgi:hypothetical protein